MTVNGKAQVLMIMHNPRDTTLAPFLTTTWRGTYQLLHPIAYTPPTPPRAPSNPFVPKFPLNE